jgi:DNA modification methylase
MGKDWDRLDAGLPQENVWKGRRGKGGSNIGTDDTKPASRHHVALGAGKKHAFKRCTVCGKRQFSGTPCECPEPEWVIEHPDGAPSSSIRMQRWHEQWAREALRVLKPGGHLLAFGGTRTSHRLAAGIEDAGFEIRDTIAWMYGSGFPKSLDVSKAIDKAAGAEREVVGEGPFAARRPRASDGATFHMPAGDPLTTPATPEAEKWNGWGTALKPAHEPIVVARKPLTGTVASTVLEFGTGALNIDGCRIEHDETLSGGTGTNGKHDGWDRPWMHDGRARDGYRSSAGRWPANVVLSHHEDCQPAGTRRVKGITGGTRGGGGTGAWNPTDRSQSPGQTIRGDGREVGDYADADGMETVQAWECVPDCPVRLLDQQSGDSTSSDRPRRNTAEAHNRTQSMGKSAGDWTTNGHGDSGGASRFFYVAKASSAERNAGLDGFEEQTVKLPGKATGFNPQTGELTDGYTGERRNVHPTVKPIELMRWLVRLVTPPGGTILDPFAGSGTTGCAAVLEGFRFVGIEREPEYADIAEARIRWWAEHPDGMELVDRLEAERERKATADAGQLDLFAGQD